MMNRWWVKFWGVRGSIPVPGPNTKKYGGNTSCLEIWSDEEDWIIFDAGTGLRELGESMEPAQKKQINLLISHPHWDHINGFPFFPQIYVPGNNVHVYGPSTFELKMEEIINGQMKYSYFPVRTAELLANVVFHDVKEEEFDIGNFHIKTQLLNHPVTCLGYKVVYHGKKFVYLGDNEPYYNVYKDRDTETESLVTDMNNRLLEFVRDVDVLVADAQYIPAEYDKKRGWGHSTTHQVVNMSIKAGVKRLFFFHHEPKRTDQELDSLVEHYRERIAEKGYSLEINAAQEGKEFEI